MKKTLTVLAIILLAATLIISCDVNTTPAKCTVTFNSEGGTESYDTVTVDYNSKIKSPGSPSKESSTTPFLGWFDGDEKFDFENTKITKDIILKAKWGYTVTFNSRGGSSVASSYVEDGQTVTKPTDPLLEGYALDKWTTDENGTTAYTFGSTLTSDITLYAQWSKIYKIGDTGPAGGIVFYIADELETSTYTDSSNNTSTLEWKYLEAASDDAPVGNTASTYIWGSSGTYSTQTAIGTGWSNTKKLSAVSGADTSKNFPAAQACLDYGNSTSYDDWFLPSIEEMRKIRTNLYVNDEISSEVKNTFQTGSAEYWSSSEDDFMWANTLLISGTEYSSNRQNVSAYVRPIRAFK